MPLFRSRFKDLGNTTYPYVDPSGSLSIPKNSPSSSYIAQVVSDTTALRKAKKAANLLLVERMANNARTRQANRPTGRINRAGRRQATRAINAPVSLGGISRNLVPRLQAVSNGLSITHSEPFSTQPLTAGGVLNYFKLALIPALMPYLDGVAVNFGKWKWTRLRLRYVPACPATTEGESALGLIYDRQDATSATFVQVASMARAISYPPWGGFNPNGAATVTVEVDCASFDKPRYGYMKVAAFNALTTSDQNNYCPVSLACATQGSTTAVAVGGRIWADYTIVLSDPIVPGINA